jgi:hypothetical protein
MRCRVGDLIGKEATYDDEAVECDAPPPAAKPYQTRAGNLPGEADDRHGSITRAENIC